MQCNAASIHSDKILEFAIILAGSCQFFANGRHFYHHLTRYEESYELTGSYSLVPGGRKDEKRWYL